MRTFNRLLVFTFRIFVVSSNVLSEVTIHTLSANAPPYNFTVLGHLNPFPVWMNNPDNQIRIHLRKHKWGVVLPPHLSLLDRMDWTRPTAEDSCKNMEEEGKSLYYSFM